MRIKLNSNKEMSKNKLMTINKPKYIYIPLICGKDKDITVLVKKGDYVCKGEIVARSKGVLSIQFHSSISGIVLDFEEKLNQNNELIKCIVIENDFKERINETINKRENIRDLEREEFNQILKDTGIIGMGGAGFPTYIKYKDNNIKTLIVNAVECEPYITADYTIIKEKCEKILECIDAILNINKIDECIIAIKNNSELKKILNTYLGTYIKIKVKIVPNIYPMGWEKTLIKYCKNVEYDKLPIEKGIVVNNVSTIYAIYEALKYNKPLIERIVTVTGDMLKKPTNVLVKVGTLASEITENIGYKRNNDITFIAGGPMMGNSLSTNEVVITSNMNSILVMKNESEIDEKVCIRCSKCVTVCPAKINPVLIKEFCNDINKLKKLDSDKCIRCGLCSYICPAKIKVRDYVIKANENLKGGK